MSTTRRGESLFLIGDDGDLVELSRTPYDAESLLQGLLARYPELIAGAESSPDQRIDFLLVAREQGVPGEEGGGGRWSLDHLFLDREAVPTLVEVKRGDDTRIRREVVGQMLDYAANAVVYWSVSEIRGSLEATCRASDLEPESVLREFLGDREPDEYWQDVKTNLQAGRVRLVFVSDEIPSELRRIIEFLNEQMDPAQVVGIEIPRFSGPGFETLAPRLVGQTAMAEGRKSARGRSSREWDFDGFIAGVEEGLGEQARETALAIIRWSDEYLPRRTFGTGLHNPSFVPALDLDGESYWPFGLHLDGSVEIKFQYLLGWAPFDQVERREELRQRLNRIEGVNIGSDRLEKRPSLPIKTLTHDDALRQFFDSMEWVLGEIRESNHGGEGS